MKVIKENEIVIREGEKNHYLYKVVKGELARYINYGEDNEFLVNVITDGKCFGETGFFTEMPNQYTVVAIKETLVLEIAEENFQKFIVQNPKNVIDIMNSMANIISVLQYHNNDLLNELLDKNEKQKNSNEALKRKIQMYKDFRF